jgi:hypothetical protein
LVKYPEKKIYTKNIIKSKDAKFYHSWFKIKRLSKNFKYCQKGRW